MLPRLLIVPASVVLEPFTARNVPANVRLASEALLTFRMIPPPTVDSVPPLTSVLLESWTSEPASAVMTPPELSKAPPPAPFRRRMPPLLACIVAWLASPEAAFGSTSSTRPETLASINAWFRMPI